MSKKLCLVTSSGGHLTKTYTLKPWWSQYDRFWVTRDDPITQDLLSSEEVYYANFPESRHLFNAIKNLAMAWRILKQHEPDVVFSMGAGVAPPFFLVAKILGINTIFMETFIFNPNPTLSGRLIYPLADVFVVQQESLLQYYPKAVYQGALFEF